MAAEGLITVRSSYGPKDTMKRLGAEVKAKGLSVFAHVDHAAGAAAVGLPLRRGCGFSEEIRILSWLSLRFTLTKPLPAAIWKSSNGQMARFARVVAL